MLSQAWLEQRYIVPGKDRQARVLLLDPSLKWLGEYSTLNIGASPSVDVESSLSQILEANVPEKYFLSSRACDGILRRAEKRGKKLPAALEMALRQQSSLNPEARTEYPESTATESVQPLTPCRGGNDNRALSPPTLKAGKHDISVAQPIAFNGRQDPISGEITGALDTDGHTQCIAYPDPANTKLSFRGDQDNTVAHAVDCRNIYETPEKSGTLQCKQSGGYSLNYQNPIRIGYRIRRFTPLECERLMGFPDGWTEGGSDTARYRSCGNSIVVQCLDFIFNQLVRVVKEDD